MKQSPKDFYSGRLLSLEIQIRDKVELLSRLSWLRVLSFLLSLLSFGIYAGNQQHLLLVATIGLFSFFIYFTVRFIQNNKRLIRLRCKAEVLQNELGLNDVQKVLYGRGSSFQSRLDFADDLDLFGDNSLFQRLNRCSTPIGEELLAQGLIHSLRDSKQISAMQEAVREMVDFAEFRIDMQTTLLLATSEKFPDLTGIRNNKLVRLFHVKKFRLLAYAMPVFVWLGLLAGILGLGYSAFSLLAVFALMVIFSQSQKMLSLGNELDGLQKKYSSWALVLKKFTALSLKSELLLNMQAEAQEAFGRFGELARISEQFDRRSNLLLYVVANLFFAYDFHLALRYQSWREMNYRQIPEWLTTLGRFEMLLSLSTFAFNHPTYCWPALSNQNELLAKALGHPLLAEDECINNDVHLQIDPRVMLITGSNMSGKSTWLRTLGINVLLAQMGAPVMAKSFVWKPMQLLSSLRQTDSLSEHTSLFMNELKQLKRILDMAQSEFSLILLDEILRGTNSEDKYAGTYELIKRLAKLNSLTVIASHDLKLSELEHELDGSLVNYCFESSISNGKLSFNYAIRKGVAVNRNASWLMKDMGII